MESDNTGRPLYEDNRESDRSRQSRRSAGKESPASSIRTPKRDKSRDGSRDGSRGESRDESRNETNVEKESSVGDRARTRTRDPDPDRDRLSDGERRRNSGSFYSDDYENVSPSERSLSPYSRSRTPSPGPRRGPRAKRVSNNSPFHKTVGAGRRGVSRPQRPGGLPQSHQQRWAGRSQSKESSPPKDLDLVTKRMLSARLLKINELRNALSELQLRTDELQKENRILRQLQLRQEKALHRYDDTESEIAQLLSRHSNETHALRERLRRAQEKERASEKHLKDSEDKLQRSQAAVARLKKLADQRELRPREELTLKLEEERAKAQEAERKIKELERCMELSSGSYQRQLAAERKKTVGAQEEIKALQEEMERLGSKLKEKERELDTRNIYANRLPSRKDTDIAAKRKVPSRNSSKAVQTEDGRVSLEFPSPPPAVTDGNEYSRQTTDNYLTLKELDEVDRGRRETVEREQQRKRDREREKDRERELGKEREREKEEKQRLEVQLNALEEKAKRLRDGWEKEKEEEERKRMGHVLNQREEEEEEEDRMRHGRVQEEVARRNQEDLFNQRAAEEERRKKEELLAKMREIDRQNQPPQDPVFAETDAPPSGHRPAVRSPPQRSEPKNYNPSIFSFTEPEEQVTSRGTASREGHRRSVAVEAGAGAAGAGRRGARGAQMSIEDLAFGSYTPSFGRPSARGSPGFPAPPPKEDRDAALEAIGVLSLGGSDKDKEKEQERGGAGKEETVRKSSLMQQLFGTSATPPAENKTDAPRSPPTTNGVRPRREGMFTFNSESPAPATPPGPVLGTLHVAESRPTVRAIASFDDDIEELTL